MTAATATARLPTTRTPRCRASSTRNVNLVDTLNGGQFTVFAPTDAAVAKLDPATVETLKTNPDLLTSILTYHVVLARPRLRWSGTTRPSRVRT